MVPRASIPSSLMGARPPTLEDIITQEGSKTHQPNPPECLSLNSVKTIPSIVQKANAVLIDELNSRAGLSADDTRKSTQRGSSECEATIEGFQKQVSKLDDALSDGLENLTEHPAQVASQLASMEKLPPENPASNLSFLSVLLPVSPGNPGYIDFTLINDDPKEPVDFTLNTTDLVGTSGYRIPEAQITVFPNSGSIKPGEPVDGYLKIRVPLGTPPGSYRGWLQTENNNLLQTVVQLSVKEDGLGPHCGERGL